jgi:hypothetical protein
MSVGSTVGISNLVTYYSNLKNLDLLSGQAKAAKTPGGSRSFLFGGKMIDDKNRRDGTQTWGAKWLDSYRTVLVQRAQTLQRKLNNIYSNQLGGNLYKSIADNPNYSMANLQRQDNQQGQKLDPAAGNALWGMNQDMNGASRSSQDPVSYEYGKPAAAFFDFSGSAWDPLERSDWGSWASRQYDDPEGNLRMPWEHIGDYFEFWNPFGGGSMPMPPKAIPLIPPVMFFKMFDFVGDMMMPLFYPMIFSRYETFTHSDAANNAIDASVIRSDYNFTAPSISQFPIVGQVIGGVLSSLVPVIVGASGGAGLTSADVQSALDMLTNVQPNAMAPRMVETESGGFFAATQALQDWDLDNMEYQYFSAANYQEDFVDTDFLAAFRKAGAKLFKILVNAILTASGIGNILKVPPLSFIADMLLEFISTMLMDGLLGPIRKFVEVDTQYQRTGAGTVDADATSTLHIGDPGGLFGLVGTAWEPAGYALAYRDDDAYNIQALNAVTVYTNRKKIDNLWDGRGILDETEWKGRTFQSTGSRLHNVGYATNPPLNLSTFRYNVQDRFNAGDTGKMDFDRSTGPGEQAHGSGGTYERTDDYWVKAETKFGDKIQTGTRSLNPSFGGGVRLTDLDTNLDDVFFYGSAAFLPDNGNWNQLTISGTNFQARNSGWSESGAEYTSAQPPNVPAPPTSPNANNYPLNKMGRVSFDGTSNATNAYVFNPTDDSGAAITGLKVTYRGPDTLTGPSNAQPVDIFNARMANNYRVTNLNGQPITAEVLVSQDQIRINHGAKPAAVAAIDWVMANSLNDQSLRTPKPGDVDGGSAADDKTTDWGRLDLGLGARIEALLPSTVNPRRDDDTTTGWNPASNNGAGAFDKEGYNFTSLQMATPAVIADIPSRLGASGTPGSGASWESVLTANIKTGNLTTATWTSWNFVKGSDKDFNGNGSLSGGPLTAGEPQSIEAASASREAAIAWNRTIEQLVPATFYKKEIASTIGNAGTPPQPSTDEWNMKFTPWNPNVAPDGAYVSTTYSGTAGVNGAPAANPFFWQDASGNEYIAVWSNPANAGRDSSTGLPTGAAQPLAVYRYTKGGTIQVLGSNSAPAAEPKPVLMHRETQIITMDDDSALGPNSKVLRTLAHLRASGFTQGRSLEDTAGTFYNMGTPNMGIPAVGTPGDFMIMKQEPGKTVTIAFTRPYGGLTDVPPNMNGTFPKEDWTAVNGWMVSKTIDGNVGTVDYTVAPRQLGDGKIWLDKSVPNNTDTVWAIQDFSHPTGGTAVATNGGGTGWTTNGFDVTWGAIWGPTDGSGRDEVSLGRKFTINNVTGGPHYVQIRADDGASVFVNGQYIGQCSGYTAWSNIAIPSNVLRPGENIVTIQAIDRGGPGGVEAQVVVNGAQQCTTADPANWQVLNSPAVSTPDEMTLRKTVTFTAPNGTAPGAAAADGVLTGDILPGEFLDISWSGANTGPRAPVAGDTRSYQTGSYPFPSNNSTGNITAMIPDRAVLTITNAKGTFTVPLTQYNSTTKKWEKKDEGSGTFHIPSDYLAAGGNTFEINVERGGMVQQVAINEPPTAWPSGWLYRNLAEGPVQKAGYWVNPANLLDDDGTVLVPAGSLLYGGKVVATAGGNGGSPLESGVRFFANGSGVIQRVNSTRTTFPFVSGWADTSIDVVLPGDYAFKPDSYFSRAGTTIDGLPLFNGAPGGNAWSGYQLKKDIRSGMSMANKDLSQELHTYATKSYDRYVYDPNTQTIMDIMQANQNGLEAFNGTDGGSETEDVPFVGSGDQVNTKVPMMQAPTGIVLMNNGVPDPSGREIVPGSTGIGKAPVGIRLNKDDRQTFGSDDNQLTRTLYAAMKPIDLDGTGNMEGDSRAYREYRDVFNYGLLDHIYISGSAYSPTGGGFSSTIEFNWKGDDVKNKATDHVTALGTTIQDTTSWSRANSYMNNYEYFANETDRRNKKYTVVRRGDMLMNSFYSFRKEQ